MSKYGFGKDVRSYGSGNAGATNVYRVFGWKPALLVILVDVTKGALPTWYAAQLAGPDSKEVIWLQILTGGAAVVGHCWTVFANFRGGKGIATGAGMLLIIYPVVLPLSLFVFVLVVWITRYASLASLSATLTLPLALGLDQLLFGRPFSLPHWVLALSLLLFVLFTHRQNIARLIKNQENRIDSGAGNPR